MNSATEFQPARTAPLPFEKTSSTRWLIRGKVMFNILMNWEELKAYFISAELAQDNFDTKYKARVIKEMLLDQTNYLYFHFATPCVQEFERLNALFQKTKADPHELHDELLMHYKSLNSRIYDTGHKKKDIHNVDFGTKFLSECDNYIQKTFNDFNCQQVILGVKQRCLSMLEEAHDQVKKRLPEARNLFKDLINYSPAIILNQVSRPIFSKLPFLHLAGEYQTIIEEQYRKKVNYRKLPFIDWKEQKQFKENGIPQDTEQFWKGVMQHPQFKELATFALTCLITPISNAVAERVFSLLTCIKTKARNRLQLSLLEATIRIRAELLTSNKCCKEFVPSTKMLSRFKADILYSKKFSTESVNNEEDNLFEEEIIM
ncbi:uncharacterized protein LOC143446600 [Clavelina lepadiformis]|uniref:uncharacterized protein LOC143446600 n=1 Tax=Clavelina lepadiformis TaxID=159417 RepID=UPI004042C53B